MCYINNLNKTLGESGSVILAQGVRGVAWIVMSACWWLVATVRYRQPLLVIATSQYTGNIISDILSPNVSDYFSVTKIYNPYPFRLYNAGGSPVSSNGSRFDF